MGKRSLVFCNIVNETLATNMLDVLTIPEILKRKHIADIYNHCIVGEQVFFAKKF